MMKPQQLLGELGARILLLRYLLLLSAAVVGLLHVASATGSVEMRLLGLTCPVLRLVRCCCWCCFGDLGDLGVDVSDGRASLGSCNLICCFAFTVCVVIPRVKNGPLAA